MKKLLLFSACAIMMISAYAQRSETNIPSAVTQAFQNEYPDKQDVQWTKKGTDYQAKYENANEYLLATYDKDGNLIEKEHRIELTSLPSGINTYMNNNAPGKTITEAYEVTDKNGNVIYEAVVEQDEYTFDSKGNYMNKQSKKDRK